VVPVRDGAAFLRQTLPPLLASLPELSELVVCDDGSLDGSSETAQSLGVRALRSSKARGPAAARNHGARETSGSLIVFLDADVRVRPDTLTLLLAPFADARLAAAFGSYDDSPAAGGWVSRYKNLAHHFVHQRGRREASTFWAGCGAVRRSVFESTGGFDERYARPSLEDVELGYRLREAGHPVRLVREAQVTHLKRWTLCGWLRSDLCDRALPWARLVRSGRGLPRDLNFTTADRAATALVAAAAGLLVAGPALPARARLAAAGLSAACLAVALWLDRAFLAFAAARVSRPFAAATAVLQLLHRLAGLSGFLLGYLLPPAAAGPSRMPQAIVGGSRPIGGR
jgi:hypothetical protein